MLHKSDFSIKKVKDILNRYDLGRIDKIEPLATSGNVIFLIEAGEKKYLLRLSLGGGPRHRSREEILAEIELLEHLLAGDMPVIGAISDKSGQKVISMGEHHGYIREYVEGKEMADPSLAQIKIFGEMLGRMHQLTENYQTKFARVHRFDPVKIGNLWREMKPDILDSDFGKKEKFSARFEAEIDSLKFPDDLPAGMIHEDLGRRHVLWRGDKIVAVIDFDRAYFGKLIWDVGQALRGWCWVDVDRKNLSECREKQREFLTGYESVRPLTAGEKNCLIDAIKFAFLERALSFCLRAIKVTHDENDADFARESLLVSIPLIEREKNAP